MNSQFTKPAAAGLGGTTFAHDPKASQDLIKLCGGAPVVIKLLEGTQGVGVVLAETQKAAESVIEAFRGLNANILVQEFIKEAGGADIRCLVVGDKVVAAMKRQGREGEFRSNLHRGGSANLPLVLDVSGLFLGLSLHAACHPQRDWDEGRPGSVACRIRGGFGSRLTGKTASWSVHQG